MASNDCNETRNLSDSSADFDIYACPIYKGKLQAADSSLCCNVCHRSYEVRDEIPDFVLEDLSRSPHWILRKAKMIDWFAPIYETKLWYPLVLSVGAGAGRASLSQLVTVIQGIVGR